ncbi:MAG: hypothetical protein RL215_1661 [Planctomycetota bacterium]
MRGLGLREQEAGDCGGLKGQLHGEQRAIIPVDDSLPAIHSVASARGIGIGEEVLSIAGESFHFVDCEGAQRERLALEPEYKLAGGESVAGLSFIKAADKLHGEFGVGHGKARSE